MTGLWLCQVRLDFERCQTRLDFYFSCLIFIASCYGNIPNECDDMHGMSRERSDMINA